MSKTIDDLKEADEGAHPRRARLRGNRAMMPDDVKRVLIESITRLLPELPEDADAYYLNIGDRHGKYIRFHSDVAEEIIDQAGCLDSCRIEGFGKWTGEWEPR